MEHKNKNMPQQYSDYEDEVNLLTLVKAIFLDVRTIKKITFAFGLIGFMIAIISPKQYTSSVVVKPILSESSANIGGGLGGLAAMAGIKIGDSGSTTEIHPTLYPKIIESYDFQKKIMESLIYVESHGSEMSFEKYFTEVYNPGLIGIIKRQFSVLVSSLKTDKEVSYAGGFHIITDVDEEIRSFIAKQITLNVDEKEGFVSLSASMPESLSAAQLVSNAQNILQGMVISHKIKKAEEDLNFIEERFRENKRGFEKSQNNLAKLRDANKNVFTAIAQTDLQRLQAEYELAFQVYSELAKQLESQKIQVKENTPVFVVLQEAVVSLKPSSRSKIISTFLYILLGLAFGILIVYIKIMFPEIKEKLNELD